MSKRIDVKPAEVQVGDWAYHKDGLDPRRVTRVDHTAGEVWLYLIIAAAGPFPIANYTFRREAEQERDDPGYSDACRTAGLGVMAAVLDVLWDRETLPREWFDRLTPDDVTRLYDGYVAPAIDRIEDAVFGEDAL